MTDIDDLARKLRDLESEVNKLRMRLGRLEDYVEKGMDPPRIEVEVVPASVVAAAAEMGATLSEAKTVARSSKESARNLRRVVSPQDDTGQHTLPKK